MLTMLLARTIVPIALILALIPLALIGLVLTRNRWLILVVVLVSAYYLVVAVRAGPMQYRLAHPEDVGYFLAALLHVLGSAAITVAGVAVFVRSLVAPRPQGKGLQGN